MTTLSYNLPSELHGVIGEVFELMSIQSIAMNVFGSMPVDANPALDEVEARVRTEAPVAQIGKELGMSGTFGIGSEPTQFPTAWIFAPAKMKKTHFEGGLEHTKESVNKQAMANVMSQMLDEFMMKGSTRISGFEGFLTASSTGTIVAPSDCNSTAGTHETGSAWVGSQATAFAFVDDIITLQNNITSQEDSNGRRMVQFNDNNEVIGSWTLFMPLNVRNWLNMPVEDSNGNAIGQTFKQFIEGMGIKLVFTDYVDDDYSYTGAEDATADIAMVYNPKDNFMIGVIKEIGWEAPWGEWLNEDRTHVLNRLQEKVMPFVRPYNIDGSYFKPVSTMTIEPWDNVAD